MLLQQHAALWSLWQQSGWGERVPGGSVTVSSLSSKNADKEVKRSKTKQTCEPQILNGFWLVQKSYRFSCIPKITLVILKMGRKKEASFSANLR